ncbi:MAG: arginine--tRNA ligase [bacterium]
MLIEELRQVIIESIRDMGIGDIPDFSLDSCPGDIDGDLSTNLAFMASKKLRKSPAESGKAVIEAIENNKAASGLIEKMEIAGKGFINFFITSKRLHTELSAILKEKENYGRQDIGKGASVQIEFVSANPTGPLHIGHGRGAAIGDSLARILSESGFNVQKEYYINNRGKQIELLGQSVMARYKELSGEKISFPEDGYKGEYIKHLAAKVPAGVKKYDKEFFKEFAITSILEQIRKDLEDFGVVYQRWFTETDLYEKGEVEKMLQRLLKEKYLYEQDGAMWFKSSAFGDEKDRVVVRADKEPTYLASDITYHWDKFNRGFDTVVDIWGADHHGYVKRVKASAQALGYSPDKVKVILYQLVSLSRAGKPQPMSTRAGEFVTLREVIDEVGTDACRFFFLMRGANSHLDFDLELAKKQSPENPVYYVQYAHARISSVFREATKAGYLLSDKLPQAEELDVLQAPEEIALIKKLMYFPELVALSVRTYDPHWVTAYVQELAKVFHNYYQKCRVITEDKNLTRARLYLLKAVGLMISRSLALIGVNSPEKM